MGRGERTRTTPTSWAYEGVDVAPVAGQREEFTAEPYSARGTAHAALHFDPTLEHPRCVFQVVKRHYARYTPEMVEEVCGVPRELFLRVADALCSNSGRDRTAAFCYAVGWTQHSIGVQYIRTASIVQLLLGNIGRPGGGILALRGHATIQGSTDVPTLYNLLPGYLPMPKAEERRHVPGVPREQWVELGLVERVPEVRGVDPEGVVGRARHRSERLALRPPASPDR